MPKQGSQPDRLPPHDRDAERALLGAMIEHKEIIGDVHAVVKQEDFYVFAHQAVYGAILALFTGGADVSPVAIWNHLRGGEDVPEFNAQYLTELVGNRSSSAQAVPCARIVRAQATMRELLRVAAHIQQNAWRGSRVAGEVVSEVEQMVFAVSQQSDQANSISLDRMMKQAVDIISEQRRLGVRSGISTGLIDIDNIAGGFHDNEFIVLAARPSVGKTAFALRCFLECVSNDIPSLFVSLEMSKQELAERILCMRGGLDSYRLRKRNLNDFETDKILEVMEQFSGSRSMHVCDAPNLSMVQIVSECRRLKLQHGLRIVFIDYLQLITPDNRRAKREEQVAAISRRLKNLSRELNAPVVALAQLNRNADGQRPKLSDLRESGSQEQDADAVYLLHNPNKYDPEHDNGEVEVDVAKNRNGPCGSASVLYVKQNMRFENLARPGGFNG